MLSADIGACPAATRSTRRDANVYFSYLGWVLPSNTLSLINAAIGPSPDIIWVSISWTAGFAIGFTLVGRLSDIFGRRWFFICSSILGLVGNIIGASAQSINMLIVSCDDARKLESAHSHRPQTPSTG